jgi:hypothetical protein
MEEALSFFWLIWFIKLELGGSNGGTGFCVMICLPLSGFDLESEPTYDS